MGFRHSFCFIAQYIIVEKVEIKFDSKMRVVIARIQYKCKLPPVKNPIVSFSIVLENNRISKDLAFIHLY